ncbi:9381_t:CDS:1, partial [Funneliformis geosporum]
SNEYQKAIDLRECNCDYSSRIPKEQFAELRESFQALSKSE